MFLYLSDKQTVEFARIALTVCAKFFVSGAYHLLFIYGADIFPSNLRFPVFLASKANSETYT